VEVVNRAFCKLFGLASVDQVLGTLPGERLHVGRTVDPDGFLRVKRRRTEHGVMVLGERIDLTDGRILERDYVPVNVEGVVQGHFWCYRDVTDRERARERLAELSNRDELTALYNRRGFVTLAEQWLRIAARTKRTPLLLFVDVNGMKPVNDGLGHAIGDRVLRDTADLLRVSFRDSDIIARLGGDEFVVLAVDAQPESAALLTDRLDRNTRAFNEKSQRPYRVSISVGVSLWDPAKPRSIEDLLAEADARMYEAKRHAKARASMPVASGI
jgi:diguanylate cyclase (GGDEF)-like protein